ncbi:PQQ-binding-like beta-propeller repeat protein [Nocardioides plantarum]|uniref:PQQ-binding-like beta-propeller repeat protein n=1 Tax=Nocardioides plantarum TaxID=29299 RepID=A0ABV5KIF9_9ACTN|nr:PQQ-binding-like beta-propeller repeat protein [Nocardioides plantarum]
MPRPRALTALALLLLLTGCSSDETRRPAEPTSSPAPTAAPLPLPVLEASERAPVRTSTRPVWTSPSDEERGVAVVGDLMLLTGERPEVVDLRSGRTTWRLPTKDVPLGATTGSVGDLNDEPALVDTADGPLVVLPYFAFACAYGCPEPTMEDGQRGAVAVDARTGDVVWGSGLTQSTQADYLRPRDDLARLSVMVEGVSSTSVVLGVADYGTLFYGRPDKTLPAYAVGLDPATGERLWARPDVVVDLVAGDLVIGRVNDASAPSLVALDARTGKERWRSTETARAVSVSPRVVVLDDVSGGARLLDSRTGRPLPQQPPTRTRGCARWISGDLDVACVWEDPEDLRAQPRLLTLGAERGLSLSATLSDDRDQDWTPTTIQDGVVSLDGYGGVAGAVDAAGGTLIGPDPDLTVVSVDDRYLVLGDGDGYDGYARLQVLRRR